MLFNSYFFIFIFLPVALIGYFSLNRLKYTQISKVWLVASSLYFYSFWSAKNLPVILISLTVNYWLGRQILNDKPIVSKSILFKLGLIFNIVLLSFFKYADFSIWNVNALFHTDYPLLHLALPLGISFFTLQQIACLVDVYEGLTKEKSFLDYAVFVSFFPQLIAGPIVHYEELMPQIANPENRYFKGNHFALGIFIFSIGLAKKVLLADTFSSWASPGFDEAVALDFFGAWKTSLAYTFQLYFDFSAYSEMALGVAQMFNVQLPLNFNSPLKSTSIIEFWTRWHMTLSRFITTYLFTPIVKAMPKIDFRNTMIATVLAMIIAGVWHGAGWTFVLYGLAHGIALVVNHVWKKKRKKKKKLPSLVGWFLTFNFVNLTFVIFRAPDLSQVWKIYKGMFGFSGIILPKILGISKDGVWEKWGYKIGTYLTPEEYFFLAMLGGAFYLVLKRKNVLELMKEFEPNTKLALFSATLFILSLFGLNRVTEFIYFNF